MKRKTKALAARPSRLSPAKRKGAKTTRAPWTSKDVAELKRRNKAGERARDIGKAMGRSEGSIRQFAHAKGISLRARRK